MFPSSPEISNINVNDHEISHEFSISNQMIAWPNLIESEIHNAIFIFAPKKTSKSDNLTFLIIQKHTK